MEKGVKTNVVKIFKVYQSFKMAYFKRLVNHRISKKIDILSNNVSNIIVITLFFIKLEIQYILIAISCL